MGSLTTFNGVLPIINSFIFIIILSVFLIGCGELLSMLDKADRFIVAFDHELELSKIIKELKSQEIRIIKKLDIINGVACNLNDLEKQFVNSMPSVRYIEPDIELYMLDFSYPEGLFSKQYIKNIQTEVIDWGVNRINAPKIWNIATGKGVKIGILDTGINQNHPDLYGSVIDGFDAIKGISYQDDNNHGTYVASVIAGRKNGVGIIGVAPESMLCSIKVMNSNGRGYISDILDGCQWSLNKNLKILNMSLGSEQKSISLNEAMEKLASNDVMVISATGNKGKLGIFYPARNNVAICVGGSGTDDKRMSWSNYGPELKNNGVLAPGDWIQVANKDGKWQRVSGTSIATPHVTGISALLMSIGYDNPKIIRQLIFEGASQVDNPDEFAGHGVVDSEKTLNIALSSEYMF